MRFAALGAEESSLSRPISGAGAVKDHPTVVRSVDVLAGGRSGLTAFVMVSAKGRRRPEVLEVRSTRNRVALLPEAQFVYVAGADETSMALGARSAEQNG